MGMGAMTTAMLGLPLTSVLITTLFLGADGVTLMPVVIVAAAISYVASARLAPPSNRIPRRPPPNHLPLAVARPSGGESSSRGDALRARTCVNE